MLTSDPAGWLREQASRVCDKGQLSIFFKPDTAGTWGCHLAVYHYLFVLYTIDIGKLLNPSTPIRRIPSPFVRLSTRSDERTLLILLEVIELEFCDSGNTDYKSERKAHQEGNFYREARCALRVVPKTIVTRKGRLWLCSTSRHRQKPRGVMDDDEAKKMCQNLANKFKQQVRLRLSRT